MRAKGETYHQQFHAPFNLRIFIQSPCNQCPPFKMVVLLVVIFAFVSSMTSSAPIFSSSLSIASSIIFKVPAVGLVGGQGICGIIGMNAMSVHQTIDIIALTMTKPSVQRCWFLRQPAHVTLLPSKTQIFLHRHAWKVMAEDAETEKKMSWLGYCHGRLVLHWWLCWFTRCNAHLAHELHTFTHVACTCTCKHPHTWPFNNCPAYPNVVWTV